MKKIGRLVLINFLVFIAIVAGIEIFFFSMMRTGLLQPRVNDIPQNKKRTKKEVIAQYGKETFEISPRVSAENTYDWQLPRKVRPGGFLNKDFDPDYYTDYFANRTQNKTYNSKSYLVNGNENLLLYDLNYEYDEFGLRRNVAHDQNAKKKKFVAAVGCSFTFGEGVPNGLDYPAQLGEKISQEYHVFNFGRSGDGFNDTYWRAKEHPEAYNPPSLEEGVVIWLFIPGHFERFFCPFGCVEGDLNWIFQKPRIVEREGQLAIDGQVIDTSRPHDLWLKLLSYSNFLRYLNVAQLTGFSREELHTMAHTYADIAFKQVKPNAKKQVYFVNLTYNPQQEELFEEMRSFGIQVLDYSDVPFLKFTDRMKMPVDTHPTSEFYSIIANLIYHDIFLKKASP